MINMNFMIRRIWPFLLIQILIILDYILEKAGATWVSEPRNVIPFAYCPAPEP